MTKLSELIEKTVPGFVMTVNEQTDILKFVEYVKVNKPWLEKFNEIILSVNGKKPWCEHLPDELQPVIPSMKFTLLYSEPNLGHTFGIFDNDGKIFKYCEDKDYEYIWKFSADVLANESIFDIDIDESNDLFYINNIGYAALEEYGGRNKLEDAVMSGNYFYPQTNYYLVKNKIKQWCPSYDETLALKQEYEDKKKEDPSITPWHAIQGCDCEHMLVKTTEVNNLKKQHLLNKDTLSRVLNLIENHEIYDGSHKNIVYESVGGLCHYHIMNGMAMPV
tara:strand:+ start:50 stop:880 length:831 start_codon:yes stop_codon:yes gene_type:complete